MTLKPAEQIAGKTPVCPGNPYAIDGKNFVVLFLVPRIWAGESFLKLFDRPAWSPDFSRTTPDHRQTHTVRPGADGSKINCPFGPSNVIRYACKDVHAK